MKIPVKYKFPTRGWMTIKIFRGLSFYERLVNFFKSWYDSIWWKVYSRGYRLPTFQHNMNQKWIYKRFFCGYVNKA